ncbi:MAG: YceI family protein [Actinomycetota bacterium]|nr:YceI family protein [Actinomycetota bacterium]
MTIAPTREIDGTELPAPGRWQIDPSHTSANFTVRHLGLSKVRGRFGELTGSMVVAERPEDSSVSVSIDASSIDTHDAGRDEHLRSADFFDTATYPTLSFASTAVRLRPGGAEVDGQLTIRGESRPVTLDVDYEGGGNDPWGGARSGFSAMTEIDRTDWGLSWNQALETGGLVVGKKVKIEIEVELVREA